MSTPTAEVWEQIKDSSYFVSSHGRVMNHKGRILIPFKTDKGYLIVKLSRLDGKNHKVHRLVTSAFLDNPEGKIYVNHKDLDKQNNHVENLEWCTPTENSQHYLSAIGYVRAEKKPRQARKPRFASKPRDPKDIEAARAKRREYNKNYIRSRRWRTFFGPLTLEQMQQRSAKFRNIALAQPKRPTHIKSDTQGAYYRPDRQTWRARIMLDGKYKSLGYYKTAAEAHQAYISAFKQHFSDLERAA